MNTHRGSVVESTVRKSGYAIKALAKKLGVSRNTIYNKFREYDLSYEMIAKIGKIIHYDFTADFPELKEFVSIEDDYQVNNTWKVERKYTQLLERYNHLLSFLIRLANDYGLEGLRRDIDRLLEAN